MFHPDEMKLVHFALLFCWVVVCPLGWAWQDGTVFFFFDGSLCNLKVFNWKELEKKNNQKSILNGRKNREEREP